MRKTFAAALLFALSVPALAAPLVLRPEVPVSAPEYGRSGGGGDLRLVTNGHDYLAVWTDFREGGVPVVYAARLRADGTLLDPLGLRIAEYAYAGPAVWTGSKYLITYESAPDSASYVRTMTPDAVFGEPLPAGRGARYGGMATNGTNVLLVNPRQAMLLDFEGNRLRDVPGVKTGGSGRPIQVAAAGSTYLVAAPLDGVVVQAVSSAGDAGVPRTIADSNTFYRLALATDGERFLVVWPEALQLVARVVGPDGTPAGPAHVLAPNITDFPSVAWRDGEYLVLFQERTLYSHWALRVAADGSPIGTPKRLAQEAPDYGGVTEVAVQGRGGIAVFARLEAGLFDDASIATEDVFRRRVDVQVTARPQAYVRIARLGDGYVAAWHEGGRIMLSTGPGTTPVAVEGSRTSLIELLVDRSNIIWVIWQGGSSDLIQVSRFWGDLTPVDPAPIGFIVPFTGWQVTAAAGDGAIALAYVDGEPEDPFNQDVYAVLLRETGTGIARKDVRLTTEPEWDLSPVVAFDGSAFVYAWAHAKERVGDDVDAPMPEFELAGARVSPDGELLDASPVRIAQDVGWIRKIDAATGANGVAFAWQTEGRTTRLALFNGTGVDLGGPQTSLAELAPHDGGFLLVHGLRRAGIEEVEYVFLGADLSVKATGALPPYPSRRQDEGYDVDVDVIGGREPVFVYAKVAHDGPYGRVSRVFVRRTGEAPPRRRVVR